VRRCQGDADAVETPIGYVPRRDAIDRDGLDLDDATMEALLRVDRAEWRGDVERSTTFLAKFADRLPAGIRDEHEALARRLGANGHAARAS
jgi:phosphoenolpyruvate carboxykinase (GTP)